MGVAASPRPRATASARSSVSMESEDQSGLEPMVFAFDSLLVLNLRAHLTLTDGWLQRLVSRSTRLRELDISDCPKITDEGALVVGDCCPLLSRLSLSDCPLLTDDSMSTLCRVCPHLQSLAVANCDMLSDASFHTILDMHQLRQLVISFTQVISNHTLNVLKQRGCRVVYLSRW
eukprot:TRINITY_DN15071_c0_g1_i1.p1 TRINITY_DN15071_c0_g1~~TRINITY_DN15071_c0_g1_i1.p1  ORF type:complete len:175 (-),score=23.92 TRINITY_DN15071_c0_g1_i1:93-617(-)